MKKIISLFLGICLSLATLAQEELVNKETVHNNNLKIILSGKILDAVTGQPLPGATVYFPDLRKGAIADAGGHYAIAGLNFGRYLVEISHLGYSSIIETVELNGDAEKDFSLQPSVVEYETVTITGVSSATSVKRTPVPVHIVRRSTLFNNTATNIIDNLSKVPGVSQLSTGPAISKPFIRGLGYNRVVAVHDGMKQEGQQWGDEHGIEIDEQSVNKVEILKGPASLMYGSDALAGVINIISFRNIPEGQTKGNISGGYFTNNRQRNLHADFGGNKDGFLWNVYGSYKAAGDYKNRYDGYVFNSKFNEKNFGALLGLNKQWGFSHVYFTRFHQEAGLVEGDRDDATGKFLKLVNNNGDEEEALAENSDFKSINPFIPWQRIQHTKIVTDNSFHIGKNRLTLIAGYQDNERQEFGSVTDPDEKELWFKLGTFNYTAQFHLAEKNNWKTSVGINGMQQTNKNKGEETIIPAYSLFDIGGFVYTQKRMNKLTLSGGLRFDNRSLNSKELIEDGEEKFNAFTRSFSNVSGSAGLAWEAGKDVILKFNIARGFRAPALAELASNGAHEGTNRYEYGQQNLKQETSLQADAGIELATEHISLNASFFLNSVQDFIYYRKLSSVNGGDSIIMDGPEELLAFQFNQSNAKLAGLEFNLDIHPHPLDWLHIENTFSWVRGRFDNEVDGSKNLSFIPAGRLINEVKIDLLQKGKTFRNVFLKAELDNTFKQGHPFTGFNTETATPGYSLLHIGVGGEIRSAQRTLFHVFAGANNITDVAYQNHLSRLKYTAENLVTGRTGVFNMGRNFVLKLDIPLEFGKK